MIARKKILIVGSDPRLLGFLGVHLSGMGHQVTSTDSRGEELKAVLESEPAELIILDILMPWMDGIELCLQIRQWCSVPIIMLSTWGARKDTVRGLDLSAESYLTEPFDAAGLMARIEGALCCNRFSESLSSQSAEF